MPNPTAVTLSEEEPISLDEAKDQCRVIWAEEDRYMRGLIAAARLYVEEYQNRQLMTATWDYKIDVFEDPIVVPRPPLASVTSVKYLDEDGVEQTLSTAVYAVDTTKEPGEIYLDYEQTWPNTREVRNAITVRFVAGYTSADNVPATTKQAILYLVEGMYTHRSPVVTGKIVRAIPQFEALLHMETVPSVN